MPIELGIRIVMTGQCDRLWPVLFGDRLQLFCDERIGFIPGDSFELTPLAFRVGAQHRVLEAVRVARHMPTGHALGTT